MNSPAHDLALKLDAEYVGVFGSASGWSLAVSTEPDAPVTTITLYDTGGQAPDTDEQDLARPTVQVRVRSESYTDAYSKHMEVRSVFAAISGEQIEGHVYVFVLPETEVVHIGNNENDQVLLTCNYRVMRYEA